MGISGIGIPDRCMNSACIGDPYNIAYMSAVFCARISSTP